MSGVGIFFQVPENDQGVAYVQHIVPRSSAHRCGVIELGDELLAAGEVGQMPTNISGKGLLVLREKILGKQGTFVVLHFQRKNKGEIYEIELMRGSPEYIEMMNMSTGLKEKQQNDMVRIHELENQVSNLKQQVQAYAAQIQVTEDPRIGPLEDELRARMDDLRRFEDMLLRAKDRTAEALRARDEAVEQLEMLKRNPGGARGWDSSEYRELQEERDLLKREISGVKSERDMVEMERNQLRAQMKEFKVTRCCAFQCCEQ
jgi:chromosome segregation ATPase